MKQIPKSTKNVKMTQNNAYLVVSSILLNYLLLKSLPIRPISVCLPGLTVPVDCMIFELRPNSQLIYLFVYKTGRSVSLNTAERRVRVLS